MAAALLIAGGVVGYLAVAHRSKPTAQPVAAATKGTPEKKGPAEGTALSGEQVYQRLLQSTVFILSANRNGFGDLFVGAGSGALVHTPRRLVITNYHVVRERPRVTVFFRDIDWKGELVTKPAYYVKNVKEVGTVGQVVARDSRLDLAILELEQVPEFAVALPLATQPAATGASVYSVGASGVNLDDFSGSLWRLSTGTVRGRTRVREPYSAGVLDAMVLETQAPINPGDSGGPVVNDRCELVGVVAHYRVDQRLVSGNIDVTEVREFLQRYFRSVGETWTDPDPGPVASSAGIANDSIDALMGVVKAGAPADRIAAARRLGGLGEKARAAVPVLLAALDPAEPELESVIGAALARIGPPEAGAESAVVRALGSKSAVARSYAARTFAKVAVPPDGIPALITALGDPSAEVRAGAAQALENLGAKAKPAAVGPLLDRAADGDPGVRDAAASALRALHPLGPDDKPAVAERLTHTDARVRTAAAGELVPLVADPDEARERWVPRLGDEAPAVRLVALQGLMQWPDELPKIAGEVLPLLGDKDRAVRVAALGAAGRMKGVPGVPAKLVTAFKDDPDPTVRGAAYEAAVAIAEPRADDLSALRTVLAAGTPRTRWAAANKIAALKAEAAPAVDDLIARIADSDDDVRASAIRALIAVGVAGRKADPAVAQVFTAAKTPEPVLAAAAAYLGAGGPANLQLLKEHQDQTLPASVRSEMCRAFARAKAADMLPWMIDQVEELADCREVVTEAIVKSGTDATVQELITRTYVLKPRRRGQPQQKYPSEYRRWALATLGKLDLAKVSTPDTRQKLLARLRMLIDYPDDQDLSKAAATLLRKLNP